MQEIDQILETWARLESRGEKAVLATVVDVSGSAYRRPGARMLIGSDGARCGSISGGCLEGHVVNDAWNLTRAGRAAIGHYDTTSPDEAMFGSGMGCSGVVRVLLERLGTAESREFIDFLRTIRRGRTPGVVATVIDCPGSESVCVGGRMMMSDGSAANVGLDDDFLEGALLEQASEVLEEKRSRLFLCETAEGRVEFFVELISPPVPLILFGAGQDAIPLVRIAKEIGWHVTVVDWRETFANSSRFPGADAIVLARPEDVAEKVRFNDDTATVLMNHHYPADLAILELLLGRDLPYIGVLGPAARTARMLGDLKVSSRPENVHAPVGLDIGADAPATIALSICAEIQAALAGRNGRMLRERRGPIYARRDEPLVMAAASEHWEAPA